MSHRRWTTRLTASASSWPLARPHHRLLPSLPPSRQQQRAVWTRSAQQSAGWSFSNRTVLLASSVTAFAICYCISGGVTSASPLSPSSEAAPYPQLSANGRTGGAGDAAPSLSPLSRSAQSPRTAAASSIHSHLSSSGVSVSVSHGVVGSIDVASYTANPAIEDSWAVEPSLHSDPNGGCAVGVFDGHSGTAASIWLRHHLLPYLQWRHLQSGRSDQLLNPRAFVDADTHFLDSAWRDERRSDGLSGACLNVVHVSGGVVQCASAGDVRAIVGRRRRSEPEGAVRDGRPHHASTHLAVPLSWDHQIDIHPGERERLLAQHPNEPDVIRRNRVKGRLQPTRGFGDGAYKEMRYTQYRAATQQTPNSRAAASTYTPPYTTAEPELHSLSLGAGDDFIVLATDGLFQDMSSQEAVDYAAEYIAQQQQSERERQTRQRQREHGAGGDSDSQSSRLTRWLRSALPSYLSSPDSGARAGGGGGVLSWSSCSAYLVSRALLHASEKHVGRKPSEADNFAWLQQLPISERRGVHDDCTVVVIHLTHTDRDGSNAQRSSSAASTSQSQIQSKL